MWTKPWTTLAFLLLHHGFSKGQMNGIPAPKNVKIVEDSVTDTGFWITWEPVSKADSYKISLSPPTIGAVGVGRGITDKFTAIEGLSPDTGYTVSIIPVKGNEEGTPSVIFQRTALAPPSSLFVVSDSVTANEMVVGWSKVVDAESYTVEANPSTGVSGTGRGIYKTSVTLRGLTANTVYTITVRPINWVGLGGAATVKQLTKLPPPSNVRVVAETVSHNSLSVHWDPVVGANTYEVTVSPPDGVLGDGQGITDTYVILRNLKADTQYRIQVAASNGAGLSDYRQAVSKTLSVCYAKGMDFTSDSFKVTCPARCGRNQEHVYGTREYTDDSYICAAAVHDGRIDDNVGGEVVVKKRPGLPHYVGTGKHGVISQDYGSWHRSFVFGLQIPQNMRVVPGSITHSSFTLEWDEVSGADAYRLSVQPDFGIVGARPGIEDTKATLSNLRPDTEYKVFLTATNTLETSQAATLEQYTALSGPKNVHVVPNSVTHDRMNISWYPVPGASHYIIELTTGDTQFTHESEKVSAMVDGLQSGVRYSIAVRPVNSVGVGGATSISQYTKLANPQNVEAESVNWHRMHVQWDAVSGATHYLITTVPAGVRNATETTKQPWIWLEDLSPDTMYDVRVQAVNSYERSRSVTIRQMTALGAPRNLVVEGKTHNSLTIKWDKVKNSDSYYVKINSIDGKYGIEDDLEANRFTVRGRCIRITWNQQAISYSGLMGRTEYKIKVVARNKIGDGKPASIGVTTLIPPPENLQIRASNINPSQVEVTWGQVHEATGYLLLVEPIGDISGAGMKKKNRALISGLKSGVLYTLTVMAIIGAEKGMNASSTFATGLPAPTNVRAEESSITTDGFLVEWDVVALAEYYNVTYENMETTATKTIHSINETSLELFELDPGTRYRLTVYAVGETTQDGDMKQLGSLGTTAIVTTKLETPMEVVQINMTESSATIGWDVVPFATHYKVTIDPADGTNGSGVYEVREAEFYGLVSGEEYVIAVRAMRPENNATGDQATITIIAGDTDEGYDYGIEGWGAGATFEGDDEEEEQTDTVEKTPGDGDTAKREEEVEKQENTWVIIVIIVVCLALLILFAVIPCLCDCCRNKPLLKYHGWCGCCSACSDVGCCGCRGCCPSCVTGDKSDDDDIEVAGGRLYSSSSVQRHDMRTQSRQSYNMY